MYNQIYDKGIASSFVQIKLYDRTLTKHLDNQDPESPPIGISSTIEIPFPQNLEKPREFLLSSLLYIL